MIEAANQDLVFRKMIGQIATIFDPGDTDLLITDPEGRQTGVLPDGSIVQNIPFSAYFPSIPAVFIAQPQTGQYTTQVTGKTSGEFEIVTGLENLTQVVAQQSDEGTLAAGQSITYPTKLDADAGSLGVQAPTALSAISGSATFGGTASFSATLTAVGMPLAGKSVAFTQVIGGVTTTLGTATTDANGFAMLAVADAAGAGTDSGAIRASFPGDSSDVASQASGTLTISQATPVITWAEPASIIYGTPLSAAQLDATANVPGTFTYKLALGTILGVGVNQTLSVSFIPNDSTDYKSVIATTTINVAKAHLVVEAINAIKVYGQANPAYSVSYSGFVVGQDASLLGGNLGFTTSATTASHVGSYPITPGGLTSPNYLIDFVAGSLNVTPAPLTITPVNVLKVYGAALPDLTVTYDGFVNGDDAGNLSSATVLTTTANSTSHVGIYPIIASGATSGDYSITFVPGAVAVTPAVLMVSAVDVIKAYDQPVPTLTATYNGFVNGDGPSNLATPVILTTTATTSSTTGFYPIIAGGASSSDYAISYVNGVLAIPPPVTTSSPGSIAFVTTLYQRVLGRAPDAPGLDGWLEGLTAGDTPAEVVRGFFTSSERNMLKAEHKAPKISQATALADAILADRLASVPATALSDPGSIALVTTLYHEILNRAPEPTGQQYWLEELAIGTTPATVALDIYHSPEHKALQNKHKAPRISERAALSDGLKAKAKAVQIAVAYPTGPMGLS